MADGTLSRQIEERVEALGYELVELERAGSSTRPILRLRIDKQGSTPEKGITLDDCTYVSREVEAYLDGLEDISEKYVLEVSSPGVERPLVKPRDFERFAGKEVAIKTSNPVADLGKRVEGVLLGLKQDQVEVKVKDSVIRIPRGDIKRANLVFRWDDKK